MLCRAAQRASLRRAARSAFSPSSPRWLSSGQASLSIPGTPRTLSELTKIEMLQDEEPARIKQIWESYHTDRAHVAGVTIDAVEYETIAERGGESPMFVFPIRRDGGHFMLLSQYTAAQNMFALTYLDDYRKNPQLAQPWASVHLFDDLLTTKAVGLLRAEVAAERLTTDEASHLLLLVRRYYGTSSYDKAWAFNHAERHFHLDKYLETCP